MFNTTRRLIRMAIVGTAAYYLYKEKPEEVKAVMDKVLPESVKKEIRKTKDQYESLQELKAAASDMTEGMAKLAGEATETLLKSLQNKEVEEQMAEIQKLRKQQKEHPEEFVPDTFTPREVELLMSELPEDRMGWSIRLMLRTGIDMYELLALTPWNIQTDGSMIRVSNQVKTRNGEPVVVPASSRYLPMCASTPSAFGRPTANTYGRAGTPTCPSSPPPLPASSRSTSGKFPRCASSGRRWPSTPMRRNRKRNNTAERQRPAVQQVFFHAKKVPLSAAPFFIVSGSGSHRLTGPLRSPLRCSRSSS